MIWIKKKEDEFLNWRSPFNEVQIILCITACELSSAGGGIPYQAAAPGISLCWHAQLRHATESVLAQTVTQPTRQILQVGSISAWLIELPWLCCRKQIR